MNLKITLKASVFAILFLCILGFSVNAQTNNVGIGTTTPAAKLHIMPDTSAALLIDAYGSGAGQTGQIQFMEISINGTNYVGFKAPDSLGANTIWVLPLTDGTSGQVLTTDGNGHLMWTTPTTGGGGGGGNSHCYTCDGF
ncbi:MAG: hypothetical protein H6581_03275 [Bacteroidia bacterium]|nr:hypothetical protein [Bacteroidia bacterium]